MLSLLYWAAQLFNFFWDSQTGPKTAGLEKWSEILAGEPKQWDPQTGIQQVGSKKGDQNTRRLLSNFSRTRFLCQSLQNMSSRQSIIVLANSNGRPENRCLLSGFREVTFVTRRSFDETFNKILFENAVIASWRFVQRYISSVWRSNNLIQKKTFKTWRELKYFHRQLAIANLGSGLCIRSLSRFRSRFRFLGETEYEDDLLEIA